MKKPQQKRGVSTGDIVGFAVACVLLLIPVAAVLQIAYAFVVLTTPDLLPLWAGIIGGLLIGAAIVGLSIVMSGTDFLDFIVAPSIILILTFILLPVFTTAQEHRLRQKHQTTSTQIQAPTKTP